ncbi:Subunit of tRNA-specific adenosine-34 deaminase, partial [Pseudoloma neurophilia]
MSLLVTKIYKKSQVNLIKASVKIIESSKIGPFIEEIRDLKEFEIPKHLKRVKKMDDKFSYLLMKMGDNPDYKTVDVSSSAYFDTRDEYLFYNKIWPVNWYPQREVPINIEYIKNFVEKLPEMKKSYINFNDQRSDLKNQHKCAKSCMVIDPNNQMSHSQIFTSKDKILHSILECISTISKENGKNKQGYLCTGMDIFLSNEPCQSCAMALIHGRIKRVFFIKSNTGIFEKQFFHQNKSFNHRFEVYKVKNQIH